MLGRIPVGADYHDERIGTFVRAWYKLHVPAKTARYAIHYLRITRSAPPDLLEALWAALDAPDLRSVARPNCDCGLCRDLRGG